MPLVAGTRLGSYEVVALIGAGGMGEVYRARDTKLSRDVALKVLPDTFAQDADRLARFRREAQVLASLNHPNIAAIYGLEESAQAIAIVMELVEGGTLAERLAHAGRTLSGPPATPDPIGSGLPVDEALTIARQVAEALQAAHEKAVVHRDLKPANIAFTLSGQVKVLDFGLAKALDETSSGAAGMTNSPTLSLAATRAGVILGTAAYMSPEQAKGRPADKRSDVWAFGCVGGGFLFPFWSPDSRRIGFFAQRKLKTIEVGGGSAAKVLCDAPLGLGGTWNASGTIVFSSSSTSGLFRVSDAGGTPEPSTRLDTAEQEAFHGSPSFLPDGRHVLYFARVQATAPPSVKIYVASLNGPDRQELFAADSQAFYADGYLLFVRGGRLLAQSFDLARLALTGEAFPVAEDVVVGGGRAAFSVSATGALTYRVGTGRQLSQLIWVDRTGSEKGVLGEPGSYRAVELSQDGARVAVALRDASNTASDIWLYDVSRGVPIRLTFDAADEVSPVWSPDGTRVIFDSNRKGNYDLFERSSSGVGEDKSLESLVGGNLGRRPFTWSRDGQYLLYEASLNAAGNTTSDNIDVWALPFAGDRKAFPFLQTSVSEFRPQFSPDGRWVAYTSAESGSPEVYVAPFPGARGKSRVSSAGGSWVRWRGDGRELYYIAPGNKVMSVMVDTSGAAFRADSPRLLFTRPRLAGGIKPYDVTPDGQRFLFNTPMDTAPEPVTVVLNWFEEIKARLPAE